MKAGEIYKWHTNKARGHETRLKLHLYCCCLNQKNIFLFINSLNKFNEGFKIKQADYPSLLDHDSYIGCTSVVSYSNHDISHLKVGSCCAGQLTSSDIKALLTHIETHKVLEEKYKKAITTALQELLN